jgi:uncharacterized protein YjiS (DUF1127 family)
LKAINAGSIDGALFGGFGLRCAPTKGLGMSGLIGAGRRPARLAASRFASHFLSIVHEFATAIRDAEQRSSQRRVLREWAEHDEQHLLRDIGVTREEARREAGKWFWQR